ncbi:MULTISPECIES: hypothetical protein [unclassified Campylobacter]|uniref:hypothetical protein n=1 Tax=unclassified Campylobacter TaxID=2593542 RepID=UPI00163B6572|nr:MULTISPECIES: hypothetical protein [unclassified Campylobacter]
MKKFFFFVAALSLSLNFTLANDLLFKASNGRLSESSVGVKKLSDAEMSEVKGGIHVYSNFWMQNYTNRYNQTLAVEAMVPFGLDDSDNFFSAGTARSNIMIFNSFANAGETMVLNAFYDFRSGQVKRHYAIGSFNPSSAVFREFKDVMVNDIFTQTQIKQRVDEMVARRLSRM